MIRRELVAYGLIALGAVTLLARLTQGAGWLWLALVAVALLAAYASQRTYGLLVAGSLLAGTSAGLLLQQAFPRWDGVFLVALGFGLAAIDSVEPREPRWRRRIGLGLAGLGGLLALGNAGVLASVWFAFALIAIGALLLWRRREAAAFPPPQVTPPGPLRAPAPPAGAATPAAGAAPDAPAAAVEPRNEPDATEPDEASR